MRSVGGRWISRRSRITRNTLAVHRPSELAHNPGGHDPVAIGGIGLSYLDDRSLDVVDGRMLDDVRRLARPRDALDRLPGDPPRPRGHNLRRPARETERRARSLPASQCFPRDLELVGLATQRPLKLADLAAEILLA